MDPVYILQQGGDMALRMWALAMTPASDLIESRLRAAEKIIEYVKTNKEAK
jgi:hypothetical protein